MKQLALHQSLIVAVAAVVFFVNLGVPRLWDRDEPRNAGCTAEMIERGDWVVPVFKGELRTHKPVLLYWLMMSAYSVFGVNELGARFWSAVLGIGTTLVTYHIGRRLFNAQVGLWAAVILSTSLMFDVAARAATPGLRSGRGEVGATPFFLLHSGAPEEALKAHHRKRAPDRWGADASLLPFHPSRCGRGSCDAG